MPTNREWVRASFGAPRLFCEQIRLFRRALSKALGFDGASCVFPKLTLEEKTKQNNTLTQHLNTSMYRRSERILCDFQLRHVV